MLYDVPVHLFTVIFKVIRWAYRHTFFLINDWILQFCNDRFYLLPINDEPDQTAQVFSYLVQPQD